MSYWGTIDSSLRTRYSYLASDSLVLKGLKLKAKKIFISKCEASWAAPDIWHHMWVIVCFAPCHFFFSTATYWLYNSPMFEYTCSPRKTHEPMQNRGEGQGAMFLLQTPDLDTSSSIGLNARLNMIENYWHSLAQCRSGGGMKRNPKGPERGGDKPSTQTRFLLSSSPFTPLISRQSNFFPFILAEQPRKR